MFNNLWKRIIFRYNTNYDNYYQMLKNDLDKNVQSLSHQIQNEIINDIQDVMFLTNQVHIVIHLSI